MREGLWRLAFVVRGLGYLAAACFIVLAAVSRLSFGEIVILLVLAAIVAGAGWTTAWIIEGFAAK